VDTLDRVRTLIKEADSAAVEERKWVKASQPDGVPVWSHDGIICTGETYKSAVKLTFAQGASLEDPARLFNASLDGHVRRAIDLHERDHLDATAFKALVRQAVAVNTAEASKRPKKQVPAAPRVSSGGAPAPDRRGARATQDASRRERRPLRA
jgi:hypothetical protein